MDYIFGYGSLIWKPPPHAIERRPGFIKGFTRRFAQSSHDHRGTPEAPGRVVTLVPTSEWASLPGADKFPCGFVWGAVYTIDPQYREEVKVELDYREKDGYDMIEVDVWGVGEDGKEVVLTKSNVYVGHITNPSFAGPMPLPTLAAHIHKSIGPSGPNKDYLYRLAEAIEGLCPETKDEYLQTLAAMTKKLDGVSMNGVCN